LSQVASHSLRSGGDLADILAKGGKLLELHRDGHKVAIARYNYLPFILSRDPGIRVLLKAPANRTSSTRRIAISTARTKRPARACFTGITTLIGRSGCKQALGPQDRGRIGKNDGHIRTSAFGHGQQLHAVDAGYSDIRNEDVRRFASDGLKGRFRIGETPDTKAGKTRYCLVVVDKDDPSLAHLVASPGSISASGSLAVNTAPPSSPSAKLSRSHAIRRFFWRISGVSPISVNLIDGPQLGNDGEAAISHISAESE
jgi:hypothetical protein